MSDWQEVKNLHELTKLNLKIMMDELDDCVEACIEAREKLEAALKAGK